MSNRTGQETKKNHIEVNIEYQGCEMRFWLPLYTPIRYIIQAIIECNPFDDIARFRPNTKYGFRLGQDLTSEPLDENETLYTGKIHSGQKLLLTPLTYERLLLEFHDSKRFVGVQVGARLVYNYPHATSVDVDLAHYTIQIEQNVSEVYAQISLNTSGDYVMKVLHPHILVNNVTCSLEEVVVLTQGMHLTFGKINTIVDLVDNEK